MIDTKELVSWIAQTLSQESRHLTFVTIVEVTGQHSKLIFQISVVELRGNEFTDEIHKRRGTYYTQVSKIFVCDGRLVFE